jgi:truncated hemoglobin YjbI
MRVRVKPTRGGRLAPDPELWEALGGTEGLRSVLGDFYDRVFADERLAPFFEDVRKEFVIDKQFSFLRSILTGARNYLGNHPRNAHSWMVISADLFDYREDLLETSLIQHGLSQEMAGRIRALDEIFRNAIIKDRPLRSLRQQGQDLPVDDYEMTELGIGDLCSGCGGEIASGTMVSYHVRTGKTYCSTCRPIEVVGTESGV